METSMTLKAKTIEEAVRTSLVILDAKVEEVDIEILCYPVSRLFGFRKQLAEVKVTKKPRTSSLASADRYEKEVDRFLKSFKENRSVDREKTVEEAEVWIENGEVQVKAGTNSYPIIDAAPHVHVYVNNKRIEKSTVVLEADGIRITTEDQIVSSAFQLTVDDRRMTVSLKITPGEKISRTIADTLPASRLYVDTVDKTEVHQDVTIEQVQMKLFSMGLMQGIDYQAIGQALQSTEPVETVIAKGIEPTAGKHGELIQLYEEPLESEETEEPIDWRAGPPITHVNAGYRLAKWIPAIEGKPGTDVFGKVVMPKAVYDVVIKTGKNVEIRKNEVIALSAGRPVIKKRGNLAMIDVVTELLCRGDVDLKHGNIDFKGDVRVLGSIREGMSVQAQGVIAIGGTAMKSVIESEERLFIKGNVFSSSLTVGKNDRVVAELTDQLGVILDRLSTVKKELEEIVETSRLKTEFLQSAQLNELIRLLVEKKTPDFRQLTLTFEKNVQNHIDSIETDWLLWADRLANQFVRLQRKPFVRIQAFDAFLVELSGFYDMYKLSPDPLTSLSVPYAVNSKLYSSGTITVEKQGAYLCTLRAEHTITVKGVCRGGELIAGERVVLGEVGSPYGNRTVIRVGEKGTIEADIVYPNTIFQIGPRVHTFAVLQSRVKAALDETGKIQFAIK